MSREDVETVHNLIDAFNAGGIEAALLFLPPDVVWYPFPEWIEESEYRGYDGIRRVMAVWTQNFEEYTVEIRELRDAGDKVVALMEQSGRIKASDDAIQQSVGAVYSRFRSGTTGEARYFLTWREALEAAGLRGSGG